MDHITSQWTRPRKFIYRLGCKSAYMEVVSYPARRVISVLHGLCFCNAHGLRTGGT